MITACVVATLLSQVSIDPKSVVLEPEAGTLSVRGKHLPGAVLSWRTEGQSGHDLCDSPTDDACTFALPKGLSADPADLELSFSTPADADAGVAAAPIVLHPAKVIVDRVLPADALVDLEAEVSRVKLVHPEAVASAECTDADCEVEGEDLVVRREQ